jgi:hypothetical protein
VIAKSATFQVRAGRRPRDIAKVEKKQGERVLGRQEIRINC